MQIVEQRGDRAVRRRQQLVLQVREGVAVRVPRLVVAQVHLHQVHARFDQLAGHQAATSRTCCGRSDPAASDRPARRRRPAASADRSAARWPAGGSDRTARSRPAVSRSRCCRPISFSRSSRDWKRLAMNLLRQRQVRGLEHKVLGVLRPAGMMEAELRIGAVGLGQEAGRLQEQRVAAAAHHAGELAGNDAARAMDQLLGQHHGRRQVVAAAAWPRRRSAAMRRPIGRRGAEGLKPGGIGVRPVSMIMVAVRMVVVRMRQRADQGPLVAALRPAAAGARRSACRACAWRSA